MTLFRSFNVNQMSKGRLNVETANEKISFQEMLSTIIFVSTHVLHTLPHKTFTALYLQNVRY